MAMTTKLIPQFKHQPPKGMHYEVEEHGRNVFSIWSCYDREFDYNLGKPVRCIWGFWSVKNGKFYSPINAKTIGKEVDINKTTPYTSMLIKITPLEAAFS